MADELDVVSGKKELLSKQEQQHVSEIMVRVVQGLCDGKDIEFLNSYSRRDPYGFINKQLNTILVRPEFYDSESVVDNWHKNVLLRTRAVESEFRARKDDVQTQKLSVGMVNQLLRKGFNKPADGQRFGLPKTKVVSDSNENHANNQSQPDLVIDVNTNVDVKPTDKITVKLQGLSGVQESQSSQEPQTRNERD
jgi:hypothetical protein